jgi:hypothetical protein
VALPLSPDRVRDIKISTRSDDFLLLWRKCTIVATHDGPENVGKEAATDQSAHEVALVRELIEALTALGNYLEAAQHEFANQRGALGEALRQSIGQYERAAECVRRLRGHLMREGPDK